MFISFVRYLKYLLIVLTFMGLLACRSDVAPESNAAGTIATSDNEVTFDEIYKNMLQSEYDAALSAWSFGQKMYQCSARHAGDPVKSLSARANTFFQQGRGFLVDGLGGDVCSIGQAAQFCARETMRLSLSVDPTGIGAWALHKLNMKSTQEITLEVAGHVKKFIDDHGKEMVDVAYLIASTPTKELIAELYKKYISVFTVLMGVTSNGLESAASLPCETLENEAARVMGMMQYQIVMFTVLSAVTVEAGGAGGALKVAQVARQLKKIENPALKEVVEKILKGLDDLVTLMKTWRKPVAALEHADYSAATKLLSRTLTQAEKELLTAAHNIGKGPDFSATEIASKYRTLRQAYSADESRALMEAGIAGKNTRVDKAWLEAKQARRAMYEAGETLNKRVKAAKWSEHGKKHLKAKTITEAEKMSASAAQYLPTVNNAGLEMRALQRGIQHVDETKNGTVYFFYRFPHTIGYDGGKACNWVRAELTSGNVFHGHPMNLSRVSKYIKNPR